MFLTVYPSQALAEWQRKPVCFSTSKLFSKDMSDPSSQSSIPNSQFNPHFSKNISKRHLNKKAQTDWRHILVVSPRCYDTLQSAASQEALKVRQRQFYLPKTTRTSSNLRDYVQDAIFMEIEVRARITFRKPSEVIIHDNCSNKCFTKSCW